MPLAPEMLLLHTALALRTLEPGALDEAQVELEPADVQYVRANWAETVVRARPWVPHKRVATVRKGTRFAVRGQVESRDSKGCDGEPWYAVWPFGYICSKQVSPTDEAPELTSTLPVPEGDRLPYAYAFVRAGGGQMYGSVQDATDGVPSRELTKGMSLAVARVLDIGGTPYVQTHSGQYVPKEHVRWGGQGSTWTGVEIRGTHRGPSFGWIAKDKTKVFDAPKGNLVESRKRRERVRIYDEQGEGKERWVQIGAKAWVPATGINEVHIVDPPLGVVEASEEARWIDVDLGEQVLVAYRGARPVYATLISSGRSHRTPMGDYPVWAKVASMTMANQEYEDDPYMVQGVPWVLLFQGHNALHAAYWHDRFGTPRSHGCVNLSPLDAQWVFDWTSFRMPAGWTGYLPEELRRSVTVHVRDSSKPPGRQFTQERDVGPPDREEEDARLAAALERREAAALAAGAPEGAPGEDWAPAGETKPLEGGAALPPLRETPPETPDAPAGGGASD